MRARWPRSVGSNWPVQLVAVNYASRRNVWCFKASHPICNVRSAFPVVPRKPPQAPCSSQAATQQIGSELGPGIPPPAKRIKGTKAEPAVEPTQPTKCKGKA
ncbi:hypothetical protein QJQ45_007997 [Haematococcus lacustris]|nr:hypothetical protein QJQ45_007997 [Haematococcus lacustris]